MSDQTNSEMTLAERVAQAETERDRLTDELRDLKVTIGQVAFETAHREGWDTYGEEAKRIVKEVGGIWPAVQRTRFTLTATFEVEGDYISGHPPLATDIADSVDLFALKHSVKMIVPPDSDHTEHWNPEVTVVGLPDLDVTNVRPVEN